MIVIHLVRPPPYSPLQSELEFSASSSEDEVEKEDVSEEETERIKQQDDPSQQSTNDKEDYFIVGDNIDKSINPRYMRVDKGKLLLQLFCCIR